MPKARSKEFFEEQKTFFIFAFMSQISNEIYVWKTKNSNLKKMFETHYILMNAKTKRIFEEGRKEKKIPKMYLLETLETTEEVAFKHCIAWTKYFIEHGFSSLNHEIHKTYTEHLAPETKLIYDIIGEISLEEVCCSENQLFADYGTIRQKKDTLERPQISFLVTEKEYETIKKKAESIQIAPASYAKRMTLEGEIKLENYSFFIEYKNSLRDIERAIREILLVIYEKAEYDPADLQRLQDLCDQAGEIHRDSMKIFNKRKYGKRTRKK